MLWPRNQQCQEVEASKDVAGRKGKRCQCNCRESTTALCSGLSKPCSAVLCVSIRVSRMHKCVDQLSSAVKGTGSGQGWVQE